MSQDCIFCKIVDGKIPSKRIYEDEKFICIEDLYPQAKKHFLLIPKKHIVALDHVFPENAASERELLGELFEKAIVIARQTGLLPAGFRSVINTGSEGGQSVFHLHLHLLGGEQLSPRFG